MNVALMAKRMAEKGFDNDGLAAVCDIAPGYMEQILRGYRPSKRLIKAIARELECQPEELAPGVDFTQDHKVAG